MNYTENEIAEHYKAEMSFIVSRGQNYSDQQAIYAIWRIMEVNRNAKQARRESLWNHFEKTVPWSIKPQVAHLHEDFEWQLANPDKSIKERQRHNIPRLSPLTFFSDGEPLPQRIKELHAAMCEAD